MNYKEITKCYGLQTFIKADILYANEQDRQGKQMKWLSHLISVSLRNVSKSQSQIKKKIYD